MEILNAEVGGVGDRLHIAYRLRVHDADGWQIFEQQTYCRVQDCQIAAMDLLCSGPQPDPAASAGTLQTLPTASSYQFVVDETLTGANECTGGGT